MGWLDRFNRTYKIKTGYSSLEIIKYVQHLVNNSRPVKQTWYSRDIFPELDYRDVVIGENVILIKDIVPSGLGKFIIGSVKITLTDTPGGVVLTAELLPEHTQLLLIISISSIVAISFPIYLFMSNIDLFGLIAEAGFVAAIPLNVLIINESLKHCLKELLNDLKIKEKLISVN